MSAPLSKELKEKHNVRFSPFYKLDLSNKTSSTTASYHCCRKEI